MLVTDAKGLRLQSANRDSKTNAKVEEAKSGKGVMNELYGSLELLVLWRISVYCPNLVLHISAHQGSCLPALGASSSPSIWVLTMGRPQYWSSPDYTRNSR
jgi:hypothetical protein